MINLDKEGDVFTMILDSERIDGIRLLFAN